MANKDPWKGFYKKQEANTSKPQGGEIGFVGNKIFAGLPQDEYNTDLMFPQSTKVYDQMRRSDGQIAAVLSAMKLPIRSTKWYVEPEDEADYQELAQEVADFVHDNLFGGMKYSWDDHLREALTMLEFGFSVFEKVYRYDTWNGRPVVFIDKYAPRVASSIWRFPQDEQYNIVEVEQINYMTGQIVNIPLNRCRVYTYNREGDNIVGISALRPAYKHWYIKDAIYSIVSVGIEKTLIGTPYGKLPKGTSEEDRQKVLDLLASVRAAEESGFTIPNDVDVSMLEGSKNPLDAMPFIEHHDTLIARSVLAQFINLGTMSSASGGSYALGNTMVDMFIMGLESVANYIQGEAQKDIEELVIWNFGPDAPIPQLKHKNISFRDMSQVAQALYWLGAGHLVEPDQDMENYIRDLFGMPPIPEEALKNQAKLPPNKYAPEVVPDTALNGKPPLPPDGTEPPKPKKKTTRMSEPIIFDDGSIEQGEPSGTAKWRRDLTTLEKVVSLAEINDRWETAEDKVNKQMQSVLSQSADDIIRQIKMIVYSQKTPSQKLQAINDLEAKYGPKYLDIIKQEMKDLYQFGSDQVAKELGSTSPTTPPSSGLQQLYAKATAISSDQLNKMLSTLKMGALNGIGRGKDPKKIMHELSMAADAYIQGPGLKGSATMIVGDSINLGRGAEASRQGVKGAQWSSILDEKTCPLCEELDGKKIKATDPDFDIFRPPLHNHCRCILVYIGNNNTGEVYNWTTPSGSLVKKYAHLIT